MASITVSLPRREITFGAFRAHKGCPRRGFPGGQDMFVKAAMTHYVTCSLNGRDTGKSVGLEVLFWEEGRQTRGVYNNVYIAKGHPQASEAFEKHLHLCEGANLLVDRADKGQDRWVKTRPFGANAGTKRWFWSGDPEAMQGVRGPRANRVGVDEAGYQHHSVRAVTMPMLTSRNGKAAFVGTAGRDGMGQAYFRELFERGVVGSSTYSKDYISFNFPIESSPFISDEACRLVREGFRDPNNPTVPTSLEREECDGAFISDIGACFRNLDATIRLPFKRIEGGYYAGTDTNGNVIAPLPGRRYVIGQDWGLKHDHSVSSVFDMVTHDQVALRIEPTNRSYDEYVNRLDTLQKHWNGAMIVADSRDAAGYAQSRLAAKYGKRYRGIALTPNGENSKGGYVARMKDLFDLTTWRLLAVPEQRAEFEDFQQIPIGEHANGYRYQASSGKHDDIVLAALFASIVMQIAPRRVIVPPPAIPVFSKEWFEDRARNRRRAVSRRGGW